MRVSWCLKECLKSIRQVTPWRYLSRLRPHFHGDFWLPVRAIKSTLWLLMGFHASFCCSFFCLFVFSRNYDVLFIASLVRFCSIGREIEKQDNKNNYSCSDNNQAATIWVPMKLEAHESSYTTAVIFSPISNSCEFISLYTSPN